LEELQSRGGGDFLGRVKRIAGTSAGSITALYLALNMDVKEDITPLMERGYDTLLDDGLVLKVNLNKSFLSLGLDHKNFKAKHIVLKALKYFEGLNTTLESGDLQLKQKAKKELQEAVKTVFRYYGEKLGFFTRLVIKVKASDFARDIVQWLFDALEPPKVQVQAEESKICEENVQNVTDPSEAVSEESKSPETPMTFQEIVKEECSGLLEDDKEEIRSVENSLRSNLRSQGVSPPYLPSDLKKTPSSHELNVNFAGLDSNPLGGDIANSSGVYQNNNINQRANLGVGFGLNNSSKLSNKDGPSAHCLNENNAETSFIKKTALNPTSIVREADLINDVESSTKKPFNPEENDGLREKVTSTAADTNCGGTGEAGTVNAKQNGLFDSFISPILCAGKVLGNDFNLNERGNSVVILPQEPSIADERTVIKIKEDNAKEYLERNQGDQKKRIAAAPEEELTDDLLPTALGELLWFIVINQQNAAGIQEQLGVFDGSVIKQDLIELPIINHLLKLNLEPKVNITFKELMDYNADLPEGEKKFKQLYVTAFNTETSKTEVFSAEHTPNVVIADAVRASMSIPVFFSPVTIREKDELGKPQPKTYFNGVKTNIVHYMDGGILDNFPLWIFDDFRYCFDDFKCNTALKYSIQNPHTLGFRLLDTDTIEKYTNPRFTGKEVTGKEKTKEYKEKFSYQIGLLFNAYTNEAQENEHIKRGDYTRSVYVDNKGVSAIAFSLSVDQRNTLIESGKQSIENYQLRANNKFKDEGQIH